MKKLVLLTVFCIALLFANAQTTSIEGKLIDSAENKTLQNAVIALLDSKDSTLLSFTRANKDGAFNISAPDSVKKIILMITHPYFADYFDTINLKKGEVLNFDIIKMLSKSKMLEEVIVKSGAPIRIKGDTTIYTADSFKVRDGANVEELLRKLPGIQVDKKGKITAMGEKVERMLVDGEEFFGNDPGIASKNLRADNVKEVEVYKAKSDQATFTGIDDGQSKQTINLKLKEDKKQGYFGKVELGGGLKNKSSGESNKFNNALMLNSFKAKRKLAGYGVMSNTGSLNLDWNDRDKYGGNSDNVEISDDGGIMIFSTGDDYNYSSGIPTNWNGGLHYSNKFNKEKIGIAAGYKFAKINSPGYVQQNSTINLKNESNIFEKSKNNYYSSVLKNGANVALDFKLDSMNTIKVKMNGNISNTLSNNNGDRTRQFGQLITQENSRGNNNQTNQSGSSNILFMHKFKKLYRTLSLNLNINFNQANGNSNSYSLQDFYTASIKDSTKVRDYNTISKGATLNYGAKLAYTEPLLKDTYLELSYGVGVNNTNQNRNVFDNTTKFKIDSISNNFDYNNISNSPGVSFKYNKKKLNISIGNTIDFTNYTQKDVTRGTFRKYNFANFNPRASLNYKIKPSENLSVNYYGNSEAPSIDDLQPITNYTDQLNIKLGNQTLMPSFRHGFSLWYNSFKMLKERYIWASMHYNFTQNAFTEFSDYNGNVRKYYTVNTNGLSGFSSNISYGFKLKSAGIRLGFDGRYDFNRNVNFIFDATANTSLKNITIRNAYTFNSRIGKEIDDKFDISLSPKITYNTIKATVSKKSNANYWSGGFEFSANWELPKDFILNTNIDATYTQKIPNFPANNFTIWNASASKTFHKKEFELKLSVNDILNQNTGYSRSFDSNTFTDAYRTTLKRFWLVSFIWNITKNGSKPTE